MHKEEKMKKRWSLWAGVALFVAIVGMPSGVMALDFGVRGYFTYAALRGDMASSSGALAGTELNLKDNLSLGHVFYPSVEAYFGRGRHQLSVMYTQFDSSASPTLTQAIQFKGVTFNPGPLQVDMRLRMLDFEYRYNVLDIKAILAGFSLGLIGKVKYLEAEAELKRAGLQVKDSARVPIPMVGVGASLGLLLNVLEARAKVVGIGYGDNLLYEADALLAFSPLPFLDIHGGYRLYGIKVNHGGYNLKSSFAGPFLGLTVGF
jgi:hypothetical protein